ncbi:uncharacterized protein LOC122501940 isoform X1 [Leptopilina heterotoma]|uniref:uncharacterized protein LOC122501940 isoform X1 n=1 Tax=Leptopilina heterotoma TaxID=63436 RepID=UPI001CAA16C9|nr:uncharacterized protein LOC122501940 isoform X1 [Leptopilina heterotoma]
MDSKSPYLEAIQGIPGKTAKEKYESLNKIINQTIEHKKVPGDSKSKTIYGSEIPKDLEPLITTEVAKKEKKSEDIVTAFKSDDAVIINRALQADWFFDGSLKSITNFNYFSKNIFPEVSVNTRTNIIKRLSQCLGHKKEYDLAKEFYEGLEKLYNLKQARPLLSACSETYLAEIVKNKNINLPKKLINRLFSKYPQLVIDYFKFGSPSRGNERVVNAANIEDYCDILPKLIKNHVNDFIDIINSRENSLNVNLGKKCAEYFLQSENGLENLINTPKKFLPLLSLKIVTKKLNKEQFELMFRNIFPKKSDEFNFDVILYYLEFQSPEMKLPLILNTFKNVYGIDLLTLDNKVTVKMLLMLPSEDRIKIVRQKLLKETDDKNPWKNWDECWTCYLPSHESIPKLKDEMSKSKKVDDRIPLIGKLLYTCKVNQNDDDLIQVLQYFSSKHRNEVSYFWTIFYDNLLKIFPLETMSKKFWEILNEMIQRSYVKNILMERIEISEQLLEKSIHYNLINNLSIDDRMTMLAELKIIGWNSHFNIIKENPKFERICLEKFLDLIPRKFPEDHTAWKDNKLDTIKYLVNDIYDYNKRMKLSAMKNQQKFLEKEFTIKNYPWLLDELNKVIHTEDFKYHYKIEDVREILSENEPELYREWFPDEEKIAKVDKQEGLNLLKKNPEKIVQNWQKYLESCEQNLYYVHTRKFLKKSIWYSEIPIKFLEETLRKLSEGNDNSIMILALLLPGSEFEKRIQHLVPNSERMDIDGDDARNLYSQASSIPPAINELNPPPPLELVAKFCQGDYLHLGVTSLMNIARRVSVHQVTAFALTLISKPISVKKHAIRLLSVVSPSANFYEFLQHMWTTETHKSIREIVFEKSYQLFCTQPSVATWNLIKNMIETLKVDDRECFDLLKNLSKIPNDYLEKYFQISLQRIEKLITLGESSSLISVKLRLFSQLEVEHCQFFSEEYCQYLLKNFTFNFENNIEILQAGRVYATQIFLNDKNKLDTRLTYFCNLLQTVINQNWNKSHSDNCRFYPIRELFSKLVNDLYYTKDGDVKILKALFNLFEKSIPPVQDFRSYLLLYFGIHLKESEFQGKVFATTIGKELSSIVAIFSPEMLCEIGKFLASFLNSSQMHTDNDIIKSVIQSFIELNEIYSSIIAVTIFAEFHTKISDDMYKNIVEKLRKVNHPTVQTVLNNHIIDVTLDDVYRGNN